MSESRNRLIALTREILNEWENTRNYWNDAKSSEFEDRFLNELQSGVNAAVTNIEALERILSKIHDDCN